MLKIILYVGTYFNNVECSEKCTHPQTIQCSVVGAAAMWAAMLNRTETVVNIGR